MASATSEDTLHRIAVDSEDPAEIWIARVSARRRRRQYMLLITVLLAMSVGYVLSPGILRSLEQNNLLPPAIHPILDFVLFPLEWAYERSEFVQSCYRGYFVLIGVD